MSQITLPEHGERFRWLHEPPHWQLADTLTCTTAPDTDYWQRTHYGFQRDNGHFFWIPVRGDFVLSARLRSAPNAQYDQCGLLVRADSGAWVKCSAEFETPSHSRLGSVVTNHGYSDWATQDVAGTVTDVWYRLRRQGDDVFIDWSEEGADWRQMRVAHLHHCPAELLAGVYACSPTGPGFTCTVSDLVIETADEADRHEAADA
jgi:regulation of enolase protein 1 (concanavalin A-like superfamily)